MTSEEKILDARHVPKNLPDDLKELINIWPKLPENVREAIKLLVKSATT